MAEKDLSYLSPDTQIDFRENSVFTRLNNYALRVNESVGAALTSFGAVDLGAALAIGDESTIKVGAAWTAGAALYTAGSELYRSRELKKNDQTEKEIHSTEIVNLKEKLRDARRQIPFADDPTYESKEDLEEEEGVRRVGNLTFRAIELFAGGVTIEKLTEFGQYYAEGNKAGMIQTASEAAYGGATVIGAEITRSWTQRSIEKRDKEASVNEIVNLRAELNEAEQQIPFK